MRVTTSRTRNSLLTPQIIGRREWGKRNPTNEIREEERQKKKEEETKKKEGGRNH